VYNSKVTQEFCEPNPLKRLPHPPYSPDISPSDFYLFGKVKSTLIVRGIPDVSGAELQRVFWSWIECVEKMIDTGGDYLRS
jgi:hypothetical protein